MIILHSFFYIFHVLKCEYFYINYEYLCQIVVVTKCKRIFFLALYLVGVKSGIMKNGRLMKREKSVIFYFVVGVKGR